MDLDKLLHACAAESATFRAVIINGLDTVDDRSKSVFSDALHHLRKWETAEAVNILLDWCRDSPPNKMCLLSLLGKNPVANQAPPSYEESLRQAPVVPAVQHRNPPRATESVPALCEKTAGSGEISTATKRIAAQGRLGLFINCLMSGREPADCLRLMTAEASFKRGDIFDAADDVFLWVMTDRKRIPVFVRVANTFLVN